MVYNIGTKNGMNGNWGSPAAAQEVGDIEMGSGTPAHAAPIQTLYVKVDATPGTSSIYRNSDGSTTWAANSDD
jgi:hypothetical protein|tara:strand:- start:621 stop:839 length:219 start_codon:yes stop_codon:yes gene_type:complete